MFVPREYLKESSPATGLEPWYVIPGQAEQILRLGLSHGVFPVTSRAPHFVRENVAVSLILLRATKPIGEAARRYV